MSESGPASNIEEKIRAVELVVLDVDGVMTTGEIIYHDDGTESKVFDVKDGHGIKLLMRAGINVAIISARECAAVGARAAGLGIELLYQGRIDKTSALAEILEKTGLGAERAAYVGDEVVDIGVMKAVGFAVAVADAVPEVIAVADYVTARSGGRGAVREVAELILKARGDWDGLMERYL